MLAGISLPYFRLSCVPTLFLCNFSSAVHVFQDYIIDYEKTMARHIGEFLSLGISTKFPKFFHSKLWKVYFACIYIKWTKLCHSFKLFVHLSILINLPIFFSQVIEIRIWFLYNSVTLEQIYSLHVHRHSKTHASYHVFVL